MKHLIKMWIPVMTRKIMDLKQRAQLDFQFFYFLFFVITYDVLYNIESNMYNILIFILYRKIYIIDI